MNTASFVWQRQSLGPITSTKTQGVSGNKWQEGGTECLDGKDGFASLNLSYTSSSLEKEK